mgnify:FL=1
MYTKTWYKKIKLNVGHASTISLLLEEYKRALNKGETSSHFTADEVSYAIAQLDNKIKEKV